MSSLGTLASAFKHYWMSTRHLTASFPSDPEAVHAVLCATTCLLLMCPDTHSAWSDRKAAVTFLMETGMDKAAVKALKGELYLLNLICTRSSKHASLWSHRRWSWIHLHRLLGRTSSPFRSELDAMAKITNMFPKNYYAWTHRRLVVTGASQNNVKGEVRYALNHLRSNPSDHCAVAYLDYAMGLAGGCDDPWSVAAELEGLGDAYPDHPTVYRALRSVALRCLRGATDDDVGRSVGMLEGWRGEVKALVEGRNRTSMQAESKLACYCWVCANAARGGKPGRSTVRKMLVWVRDEALRELRRRQGVNDLWKKIAF